VGYLKFIILAIQQLKIQSRTVTAFSQDTIP